MGRVPKERMGRIGMVYEMSMEKNSVALPKYWESLLAQMEFEQNVGWGGVSLPLTRKQAILKQACTLIHESIEEAANERE